MILTSDLRSSVEDKLVLVEEKITSKLASKVDLVHKMTNYHLKTGGKIKSTFNIRKCKTLWIQRGSRDINLAAVLN